MLVVGINLLAAGGIAYPAIAGSLWMLLATSVNHLQSDPPARTDEKAARPLPLVPMLGLAAIGVLGAACYVSAFAPAHRSSAALERAAGEHLSTEARETILLEAATA